MKHVVPQVLHIPAMVKYRFVSEDADGTWKWRLHREEGSGFPSAHKAACNLAARLRVKLVHLKEGANATAASRPSLPEHLEGYPLLWSAEKLGWFSREKRIYYIEPEQAVQKGKLEKKHARVKIQHKPGPLRKFRGVTFHVAKGAWVAQTQKDGANCQVGGLHETQQAAAEALAEHLEVSVDSLRKESKQSYQRPQEILSHFGGMMSAFKQIPFPERLPGDLVDLVQHAKSDRSLPVPVRALVTLFKYGPYREALRRAHKKYGSKGLKETVQQAVVSAAAISPSTLAPWRASVGRNVSHHHGFLPTLQSFGVIKKLKKAPAKLRKDQLCCGCARALTGPSEAGW